MGIIYSWHSRSKLFNKTVRDKFKDHANLNPISSELPSIESMGFWKKVKYAFPYHPIPELYLCHLKIEFEEYKVWSLVKRVPSLDEITRRYWRKRLLVFLKREYSNLGIALPQLYKKEQDFFVKHPHLWDKWQAQKAKHTLLESKRYRFGKRQHDFEHYLQYKWMVEKKYEYFQRYTGLREEPYWRRYTRGKALNIYSNLLISCNHWECWLIRIRYIPLNLFMWLKFRYLWKSHPEWEDIH